MRTTRTLLYLVTTALLIVWAVNLISCKSKASYSDPSKSLPDTSRVIGVFVDLKGEDIRHDIVFRVTKDSFGFVDVGSDVKKKQWYKDSLYFVPVVDSARDRATGKPSFDSTGKAIFTTYWIPTEREKVWDTNIKVDSAVSRFQKFLKQKPKP